MDDSTTPQGSAAMSPASTGSVSKHIDVEELICELHHIAGSESIDVDVRRVVCVAESALARLRAWVNELQMNVAERAAVDAAIDLLNGVEDVSAGACSRADAAADTLRGLLERHK